MAKAGSSSEPSSIGDLIGGLTPGKSTIRTQTLLKSSCDAQESIETRSEKKDDSRDVQDFEELTGAVLGLVDGDPETLATAAAKWAEKDKARKEEAAKQAQERMARISARCLEVAASDESMAVVGIVRVLTSEFVLTQPEAFAIVKSLVPDRVERDKQCREDRQREQIASEEAAKEEERIRELFESWWPEHVGRFAACRLSNFKLHGDNEQQEKQRGHLSKIRNLDIAGMVETGKNILFVGPAGTGKDHLMHAMAAEVLGKFGRGIVAYNGAKLRSDLRKATLESAAKEVALIQSLVKADLLMLSDPAPTGSKELSDYQADALYHIVDQRWSKGKSIWATLNLPVDGTLKDAAIATLTAPVYDRLRDNAIVIICNWESYRRAEMIIR